MDGNAIGWRVRTFACQSRDGPGTPYPVPTQMQTFQANPLRIITISTHLALGDGNGSHLDSPLEP